MVSDPDTLGAELTAARNRRELTLDQVERQTRIRAHYLAALEDNDGLAIAEIMVAAELRNRNAVDILLFRMSKAGKIERVKRGVYGLPGTVARLAAKNMGKIGKKERSRSEATETTA